jgi:mRNA interferase HicA
VKRKELQSRLAAAGWRFLRAGGKHDIWASSDGTRTVAVPRHTEIHELLARKILAAAR